MMYEYRVFIFFFEWCGGHRDLHSFPTRRSSDLPRTVEVAADELHRVLELRQAEQTIGGALGRVVDVVEVHHRVGRSEEHTSELQSHVNLVCRLLLEKKNQSWDDVARPCHHALQG